MNFLESLMDRQNLHDQRPYRTAISRKVIVMRHQENLPDNPNRRVDFSRSQLKDIYLAGGCFWGVEAYMARVPGVADARSGYANGRTENPTYEDVCYRNTGHAETVRVSYDPARITLADLLRQFFSIIDPTTRNRQGNDVGSQYRTAIFYTDPGDHLMIHQVMQEEQKKYDRPIVTQVEPLRRFDLAEEYHQRYLEKNPNGYCHVSFATLPNARAILQHPIIDPSRYPKPPDALLKAHLPAQSYAVTQENATERPFTGKYWNHNDEGLYVDIVTGEPLFTSKDKFPSDCGWPSFSKPIDKSVIVEQVDKSFGMVRTEVRSRSGDSHLGHVFTDGPRDRGGLRYCINSASLRFIPKDDLDQEGYSAFKALFDKGET